MRENNYAYIGEEYAFRLGIYLSNMRYIKEHNKAGSSYKLEGNRFAAFTPAEYRSMLSKPKSLAKKFESAPLKHKEGAIPAEFDWRTKGVVTPVRYQEGCGAGWAFASAALQESMWAIYDRGLAHLSVQQLLDCDYNDDGCDGGSSDGASYFVLLNQYGMWMSDSDYPFKPYVGECKFDSSMAQSKFVQLTYTKNETDMAVTVATHGVLACGYDASAADFEWYSSCVYDNPDCDPWASATG